MDALIGRLKSWFPEPSPQDRENVRQVRPFFYLVVIGLAFVYFFSLRDDPGLREPARLLPFTLLIVIHAIIHWNLLRFMMTRPGTLLYLILQGALGMVIILVGRNLSLSYGIYMALIGETLGILGFTPMGFGAVAFFLVLSGGGFLATGHMQQFWIWAVTALGILPTVVIYVLMFRRQIDAREKAQGLLTELETAHRQLSEYAVQVEDLTLAAERRRMARELHDTLSQGLAGLILQIEAAGAHLEERRVEKAQAVLQQALGRARETLADARRAIGDLREEPDAVTDLPGAILEEIERFRALTGIPCDAHLDRTCTAPEALRETALRAAAEGLFNIARHAGATHAVVELKCTPRGLRLIVTDDGKGFDPEQLIGQNGHYGLLGLRERCRLAGGTLTVTSHSGQGTRLELTLPFGGAA